MFVQALLVALVGIIATIDYNGPLFMIHRPLVTGTLTGLVLGDMRSSTASAFVFTIVRSHSMNLKL